MFFVPDFKPLIMAIHGSASTARQWQRFADDLRRAANVMAPDLPGYGRAAGDKNPRLRSLERAIAGRAVHIHLVAHSFGGAVALKLAQARPEREDPCPSGRPG